MWEGGVIAVDVKNRNGVIVLKPRGRLIGHASNELRQVIETQLQETDEPCNFLFDFADCLRIDSSAVGVLVELYVSIAQWGGVAGVTNFSNSINSYFVMAKLITAFKHFKNEEDKLLRFLGVMYYHWRGVPCLPMYPQQLAYIGFVFLLILVGCYSHPKPSNSELKALVSAKLRSGIPNSWVKERGKVFGANRVYNTTDVRIKSIEVV